MFTTSSAVPRPTEPDQFPASALPGWVRTRAGGSTKMTFTVWAYFAEQTVGVEKTAFFTIVDMAFPTGEQPNALILTQVGQALAVETSYNNATTATLGSTAEIFKPGQWHHVTVFLDLAAQTVDLRVNQKAAASFVFPIAFQTPELQMGGAYMGTATTAPTKLQNGITSWDGMLEELKMFDVHLNDCEVEQTVFAGFRKDTM